MLTFGMVRRLLIALGFPIAAVLAFVAAIALSVLTMVVKFPHDDSPALGMLWTLIAIVYAAILVPLVLCGFAVLVDRSTLHQRPKWLRLLGRLPFGFVAYGAMVYSWWVGVVIRHDVEPFWLLKSVISGLVALTAGYAALRIRGSRKTE